MTYTVTYPIWLVAALAIFLIATSVLVLVLAYTFWRDR